MNELEDARHLLAGRLATDYLLRAAEGVNLTLDGDLTMGLVFLAVVRANCLLAPGAACRPISGGALSASLRIPAETVRRKVKSLIEAGYLRRERGGLVAAPDALKRPEIARVMRANYLSLKRLMRQLKRLGLDAASA